LPLEEPGGPDHGVPGERDLHRGGVDPYLAAPRVVDEHRLAEAEVRSDVLPPLRRHGSPLEEDAERVAAAPIVPAEHSQHVQSRHLEQFYCRAIANDAPSSATPATSHAT